MPLEDAEFSLSKRKNWILMGNSYVGTPSMRKAFGTRMINPKDLSFHAHFRNTVKAIS